MARSHLLLLGIVLAFCACCTATGRAEHWQSFAAKGDAYYVLGISPPETHIVIADGKLANGVFERNVAAVPFSATLMDVSGRRFVVGKTQGGTALGLVSATDVTNWPDPEYPQCGPHRKMLTFTPRAGTVVYITSLEFHHAGGTLAPSYKDDIDAARDFLKVHYPDLAGKLKHGRYELVTATSSCDPNGRSPLAHSDRSLTR